MAKIAICGSFSTGKTTLAKQLARKLKYKLLPEVARMMIEDGFRLDLEVTPAIEMLMVEKQEELEQGDDWVADRCLIDILAYSMVLFQDDKFLNEINDRLDQAKYDIIFFIPIEFPIKDDGVRSTDAEFQKKIDRRIREILKGYKCHTLRGDKKTRLDKAIKICTKHLSA